MELYVHDFTYLDIHLKIKKFVLKKCIVSILWQNLGTLWQDIYHFLLIEYETISQVNTPHVEKPHLAPQGV